MAPSYTIAQVDHCSFDQWYYQFSHLTFKSKCIPLSPEFLEYLKEDGVKLPSNLSQNDELTLSDDEDNFEEDDENGPIVPEFQKLQNQIQQVLEKLGGSVFIKMNWSSPRDASWMLGGLECKSVDDIFLLLKSSDFIMHDVEHAYASCVDAQDLVEQRPKLLVCRQYSRMDYATEFRCFVANNTLHSICQRQADQHDDFLNSSAMQCRMIACIVKFFITELLDTTSGAPYSSKFPDPDYIFDCFVESSGRVRLVDFNVYGQKTDTLLYSWEELQSRAKVDARLLFTATDYQDLVDFKLECLEKEVEMEFSSDPEFLRIVTASGTRPSSLNDYRVPIDFHMKDLDLASAEGMSRFLEQVTLDNAQSTFEEELLKLEKQNNQ